jgi:TRAP-type C4-dicarboxylate transport system substrate-binding protein
MGKKTCLWTLAFGLTGLILLSFVITASAPAAAIEWKMQTIYPSSDSSYTCQTEPIVKAINEKMKGKLHITLFQPGQIVPEEQMFDALKRGVFDAAYMAPTWYQGPIPDGMVGFCLPMGWQGYDMDMEFFYKFGFIKYMRDIHAEQNVYYAAPMPFGDVLLFGNFPFRKLEDIKGKKIWCIGTVAAFMKNLGAVPVTFPNSEVYMALKLGTLDGAIQALSDVHTAKFQEIIKYLNVPPILSSLNASLLVSLKTWNNTPKDVQKAFEDIVSEALPESQKCFESDAVKALEECKKAGVQIITMEPSEIERLKPAAVPVWDAVAKRSDRAPKTVQMLKDFLATKGIKIE